MKKQFPTVLVLSAHPDDAIIAMGGTMAKLAKDGYDVINVVFSCAQQNQWWLRQVYSCDMVMSECIKAGTLLGCRKTVLLGTDRNPLSGDARALRDRIAALIAEYRPEHVYTHIPDGRERDHRRVATLVEAVLRDMRYRGTFYRYGLWTLDLRRKPLPQLLVDITPTFLKKRQAVKLFRSRALWVFQLWPLAFLRAWKAGFRIGKKYAELFYVTPI